MFQIELFWIHNKHWSDMGQAYSLRGAIRIGKRDLTQLNQPWRVRLNGVTVYSSLGYTWVEPS